MALLADRGDGEGPRLTDRRRVGLLLQGAALLAHLDAVDCHLSRPWRGAGVGPAGELCGVAVAPGGRRVPVQEPLRELVALLFGLDDPAAGTLPGRGEGRRAVRRLLERWRSDLAPLPPHRAVTEILEVAPFLWKSEHAADRRALAAERGWKGERRVLLAGSGNGAWRRQVGGDDLEAVREVLAGSDARSLWRSGGDADPERAAAAGRWWDAVEAWALRPPESAPERLAHGEALLADGRFAAAAEVLGELAKEKGEEAAEALAGALRARLLLGELEAVRRRLVRLKDGAGLPLGVRVRLADVAQRAFVSGPSPERAAAWVDGALRAAKKAGDGDLLALAHLVAAVAAWDRGEPEAMDRHLEAARPAVEGARAIAWRWHQAAGLRAMAVGDGPAIVEHLTKALAAGRRALRRDQAGGLWSDLGVGRAGVSDLAGAERAFLHAQRLFAGCDGPRRTTLALHNLAEIRLRRGRIAGVEGVLDGALEENRLAGNVRGQVHDLALLARYELALGRPEAALAYLDEAADLTHDRDRDWHRDGRRVLAARALGWLGRSGEAAEALDALPAEALSELEPEERPALFAHAGSSGAARELAGSLPDDLASLWHAALDGAAAPSDRWGALTGLEPYRAARLVFDLELLCPGLAPPAGRRRAVATLRRIGAAAFAERLERSEGGTWLAVARYLERSERGLPELRALFEEAGVPEARIERRRGEPLGRDGGPEILIGGVGGREELSAPLAGDGSHGDDRLVLRVAKVGPAVRALFALAVREIVGDAGRGMNGENGSEPPARRKGAARRAGIVGESPLLRRALERAGRLASGDLPVLVTGESGTGKELVARLVHRESPRRDGELVAVNCAALSENLLLSDLFGHVRGAFTGADRERAGVFETARGGTVFLDEIGDLPLPAQGTLLRVLQEGEVRRLGESLPRKVDARLVAATHRDLAAMVEAGSFRRDLFFRLSVARVELPPLRERDGDALRIADALLAELAPGASLTAAARAVLAAHPWPGNVRELRNVLEVAVALAGGEGRIDADHLEIAPESGNGAAPVADYHQRVEAYRRRLVEEALAASGGNRAEAARRLGLSRQALSYLAKQLRLV